MLFTTGTFLFLYLPITLAGFFLLGRVSRNAAAIWLALASVFFYGYWMPAYTALLLASVAANFLFGTWMMARRHRGAPPSKPLLITSIAFNLIVLAYYKYFDFAIQTINDISGSQLHLLHVILPLGISFFTFTQIAYLADLHAGKVRQGSPGHYLLFVTYFPHLVAGPVLHHAEMMPQFKRPEIYRPRLENFFVGLCFLVIGLIKKVLIADSIAPHANDAFDNVRSQHIGVVHAWFGALSYTFQLYFDFSGYSDMAVGLSLMIGVQLPYNFNSPYQARSIIDFWRRWHMTLSRFLRDYLYFSLGGSRKGKLRRHVNLLLTMLLGGLWHGASWTFVVWGGLHGAFLVVNHGWRYVTERFQRDFQQQPNSLRRLAREASAACLTLCCVVIAWVFFRAKTLAAALSLVSSMFCQPVGARMSSEDWSLAPWLAVLLAWVLFAPNSQRIVDRIRGRLAPVSPRPLSSLFIAFVIGMQFVAVVMLALISARREATEFIYFNF